MDTNLFANVPSGGRKSFDLSMLGAVGPAGGGARFTMEQVSVTGSQSSEFN